ncbi:zinc finger protein 48 [Anopheles funestus]|uniref:zinc finger protein 48 n=1 Tax=Anopheles funestus TaxID=62324 RepID=UPI0020C6B7D2|nr:zinc finger protein 48 [Anopheles funestus]
MFPSATFATTPGAEGSPPFVRKFRPEIDLHLNVSPEPMSDGYEAYADLSSQSSTSATIARRAGSPSTAVCAIGFLPIDSVSKGYIPEEVCLKVAHHSTHGASANPRTTMIRKSSSTGLLTANESVTAMKSSNWIRSIRLASDVRSFNALLELTTTHLLRVRLTGDVNNGEELKLWFSEDVIAHMQIPFLTPINIQRQNCYVCHLCQKSYEYPNPLKIHLATSCNREPISILWHRLHQALATRYGAPFSPLYDFQPWRNSAFRPVLNAHAVKMDHISPPSPHRHRLHQPPPVEPVPADEPTGAHLVTAAHLETIVSNMGSSKQGHVCIYCGKLYSRKYGLKIHIRTHTGFKPLKCQYCLRPFGDPSNLNKHIRLHRQHDGSLYECNLCGKKLARRRDLQRHLQARHNSTQIIDQSTTSEDDDDDREEDGETGQRRSASSGGRRETDS